MRKVKETIAHLDPELSVSYQRLSTHIRGTGKGPAQGAQMKNLMFLRTCGIPELGAVITLELRNPYNCKTGFPGLLSSALGSESETNVVKKRRLSKAQAQ